MGMGNNPANMVDPSGAVAYGAGVSSGLPSFSPIVENEALSYRGNPFDELYYADPGSELVKSGGGEVSTGGSTSAQGVSSELPYFRFTLLNESEWINVVPNACAIVENTILDWTWNSALANYESVSRGTWGQDIKGEAIGMANAIADNVTSTTKYYVNTPLSQMRSDFVTTFKSPSTYSNVLATGIMMGGERNCRICIASE